MLKSDRAIGRQIDRIGVNIQMVNFQIWSNEFQALVKWEYYLKLVRYCLPLFCSENANHGLESLLKDEELEQLRSGVSKNASPKHRRKDQTCTLVRDNNCVGSAPRLSVPPVGLIPTVRNALAHSNNLRTRSSDSLPIERKAHNNLHKIVILPSSTATQLPGQVRSGANSADSAVTQSYTNLHL